MPVGVDKNVCQTVFLFDGLSVHPFICSYTVFICFCLSVCLPALVLSAMLLCVRPCVRPSA